MNSVQYCITSNANWIKFGVKFALVVTAAHRMHLCFTKSRKTNEEQIDYQFKTQLYIRDMMYETVGVFFLAWGGMSIMRDFELL